MACVAEFGIIDRFDEHRDYSVYEPENYRCIAINDDFLSDWWNELKLIRTYFHSYDRPGLALARWGVTLIPPDSLETFYGIVSQDKRSGSFTELIDLRVLLRRAMDEKKYVIHYGV